MKYSHKLSLPITLLSLLIISANTALPDRILGRNLFIFTVFIVVLLSNYRHFAISKNSLILATALSLFGISQTGWSLIFANRWSDFFLADTNYHSTGGYLLTLSTAILLLGNKYHDYFNDKNYKYVCWLAVIGFSYMCCVGFFYCYQHPGMRLRLNSPATLSAYLLTLQCFITLYILNYRTTRFRTPLMVWIIIIGFIAILLTQTRSAILCFPLILVGLVCCNRQVSLQRLVTLLLMLAVVLPFAIKLYFPSTLTRVESSYTEIASLNHDNNTSVGARISMWRAGLYASLQHPMGQSAQSRFEEVSFYIDHYQHQNPEAKRNAIFHLHNDFIESLSLRGVMGGLIFLMVLLSLFYYSCSVRNLPLFFPLFILPIIVYGLVDTLFIDKGFIITFSCQLLIYQLLSSSVTQRGKQKVQPR